MSKDRFKRQADIFEWGMDEKPKGKNKRAVHSRARAKLKEDLMDDMEEWLYAERTSEDWDISEEIDEALYCNMFGPCEKCRDKE